MEWDDLGWFLKTQVEGEDKDYIVRFVGFYKNRVHVLLLICVVHEENCQKTVWGS